MQQIIKNYLENLQFGEPQTHAHMTVVPLLAHDVATTDYLMLDEALAQNLVSITEVSEQGSIKELMLTNNSEKKILVLDGEEVIGAKQNRILNCSMLIAAQSTMLIPVSCCESGRWGFNSLSFTSENRMAYRKLRQRKAEHISLSTRQDGSFRSNQGEVWNEIQNRINRRKSAGLSTSSAMSCVYQIDKADIDAYIQNFSAITSQVGALFIINSSTSSAIAGIDSFGKALTFSKVSRKLYESYALDALDIASENNNDKVMDSGDIEARGKAFIQHILDSDSQEYKSVGLGTDTRFSQTVNGFALTLQSQLLHLSAFPLEVNSNRQTKMLKSSMRRQRMH